MGLSDIKKNLTSEPTVSKSPKVERAGVYCMEAEKAVADAIIRLGEKCFADNLDNEDGHYYEDVKEIKRLKEREILCKQYKLSLESKRLCEHCGVVVTSDSLFCNKCGEKLDELDFSAFGSNEPSSEKKNCPSCGKTIAADADFCEYCGTKVK